MNTYIDAEVLCKSTNTTLPYGESEYRKLNNDVNACEIRVKGKTIKNMLEELDEIQGKIEYEVRLIADAVYRGSAITLGESANNEPRMTPPMTVIIEEHVGRAEALLIELVKIKEALW